VKGHVCRKSVSRTAATKPLGKIAIKPYITTLASFARSFLDDPFIPSVTIPHLELGKIMFTSSQI
jgi:hypothetical protein